MKPVDEQIILNKLTDDSSSDKHSMRRIILLVKSLASKNAQFLVMIFEFDVEQFQCPTSVTAAITKLRVAAAALHMIATPIAFNVDLK